MIRAKDVYVFLLAIGLFLLAGTIAANLNLIFDWLLK